MPRQRSDGSRSIKQDAFADNEGAMRFLTGVLEASTEYSIIATDIDGVIRLWNEGARRLYGHDAQDIIGQPQAALHTERDVERGRPELMMRRTREHGKWEGTVQRLRKDQSTFTARVVMTLRRDPEGTPIGFLLISNDITGEQRLTAEREQARYIQSVLESAPDAMLIVTGDGEIQLVNAETERLFGYSRQELIGQQVEKLIPDRYGDRDPGRRGGFFAEHARAMGAGLERSGRRKDGVEFPIEVSLNPLETGDGRFATAAIRDVTERKLVEHDLREANIKLEEASKSKDRFLASMSHELRTPLNAILGFTGTLLMGLPGPLNAEQTGQLQTVQASGRHLLSLINDLLDLARIEAGKVDLNVEEIVCQEVLDEVIIGLRPLADPKGIELAVIAPADPVVIRTDRRTLSQILINLTNNAIKFTDDGSVRLEVSQHTDSRGSVTRFAVADTGPGIKTVDQGRMFAAFEQIGSSTAQPYEGTGLGLYICQTLATFIGASITLDSESGRGSTFALELPA